MDERIKEIVAELERFAEEEMVCIGWRHPVGWSPDGERHFTEEDCRNWVCNCPRCKFLRMLDRIKKEV